MIIRVRLFTYIGGMEQEFYVPYRTEGVLPAPRISGMERIKLFFLSILGRAI